MRLFDGRPSDGPRAEIAPDSVIQRRDGSTMVWQVTAGEDLLVVCLYDGSGTYYYARWQDTPGRCVMDDSTGLILAWCD
jgi:hypothetical protein